MKNKGLEYKGYRGMVDFDPEHAIFHGEVLGIHDVITFQGQGAKELIKAFQDSVDDYLDWCKERGEKPEKPFSGKFNLRIDPQLHRRLTVEAELQRDSLNAFIEKILLLYLSEYRGQTKHK